MAVLTAFLIGVSIFTIMPPDCDGRPTVRLTEQKPTNITQLKDIFLGRCSEFQTLVRPELFPDGLFVAVTIPAYFLISLVLWYIYMCVLFLLTGEYSVTAVKLAKRQKNCGKLWTLFSGAFTHKDPCDVYEEDFREYISAAAHPFPRDSAVLWAALNPFVYRFTDDGIRGTALADYLAGYIAQGTTFCGSTTGPSGMNATHCPSYASCPGETNFNFWRELSNQFTQKIRGLVRVALNGTRDGPAFGNRSIFFGRELPNLRAPNVTKMEVWLVHDIGKEKTEVCGEGSLIELENIAVSQNLTFSCIDDPPATLHLLCVSKPTAKECQLRDSSAISGRGTPVTSFGLPVVIAMNIMALLITMGGS